MSRPFAYDQGRFGALLVPYPSPSSLDHLELAKRLLSALPPPPPYTDGERRGDAEAIAIQPTCYPGPPECSRLARQESTAQPYLHVSRTPSPDMDDVPLGHLLAAQAYWEADDDTPCADEAPPSYAVAVRQSYRDTLLQHIRRGPGGYGEVDEESEVGLRMAMDAERGGEEPCAIARIVAMFAMAVILFVVSGVLGWMVLNGILG